MNAAPHFPTTVAGWVGFGLSVAAAAYLLYAGSEGTAMLALGIALAQLGIKHDASRARELAAAAVTKSDEAASVLTDAVAQVVEQVNAVQEGIDDIRNNPAMPGTPTVGGGEATRG